MLIEHVCPPREGCNLFDYSCMFHIESPFIPPGEAISSRLVLLEFVPGAYLGEESMPRHVLRSAHPVHIAVSSSQVLAHGLELLPLRTPQASYIDHGAMMMLRSIHIPPFTPTIAAPNSSHNYFLVTLLIKLTRFPMIISSIITRVDGRASKQI